MLSLCLTAPAGTHVLCAVITGACVVFDDGYIPSVVEDDGNILVAQDCFCDKVAGNDLFISHNEADVLVGFSMLRPIRCITIRTVDLPLMQGMLTVSPDTREPTKIQSPLSRQLRNCHGSASSFCLFSPSSPYPALLTRQGFHRVWRWCFFQSCYWCNISAWVFLAKLFLCSVEVQQFSDKSFRA